MSQYFDGTAADIRWTLGASEQPRALLTIVKIDAPDKVFVSLLTAHGPDGKARVGFGRHSSDAIELFINGPYTFAGDLRASMGWALVGVDWDARVPTPRVHVYRFDTGQFVHVDVTTGPFSDPPSAAGGHISFGNYEGGYFFKGWVQLLALFGRRLSDAEWESMVAHRRTEDILRLKPSFAADDGDAFATDLSGHGARRVEISGATAAADRPPGWLNHGES
jgi:hypothetical protein